MSIRVACTCGEITEAPDEQSGQRIACPACGTMLTAAPAPFPDPVVLDYASGAFQSSGFRMRRADWIAAGIFVGLLLVIGFAILTPALSRSRRSSLAVACGSNVRQLTYAALGYANNWKDQLPTAVGIPDHRRAYPTYRGRLPIVRLDTCTLWNWQSYQSPDGMNMLGGWAFMMRDYMKNDFRDAFCPDGYARQKDMAGWDGSRTGRLDCPLYDHTAPVGYLWLPHRRASPSATIGNCCNDGGPGAPVTDQSWDVARKSTDKPELLVVTDWNQFESRNEAGCGVPANTGCGVLANHVSRELDKKRPAWATGCTPQVFPPGIGAKEDPMLVPLGMNKARIDARVRWESWQDWDYFRWGETFNARNGRWHGW